MKKLLITMTTLPLSLALAACSNSNGGNTDQDNQCYWQHKQHMHMVAENAFHTLDKNGDGFISRKEYEEYTRKWFKEADVNHDGKLTAEEFTAQLEREKQRIKSEARQKENDTNDNADEK